MTEVAVVAERVIVVVCRVAEVASRLAMVVSRVAKVASRLAKVASVTVVVSKLTMVANNVAVVAHGELEMVLGGGVIGVMVLAIEVAVVTPLCAVLILLMRCLMSCPREVGVVVEMMR